MFFLPELWQRINQYVNMVKKQDKIIWMLTFVLAFFLSDVHGQSAGSLSILEDGFVSVFGEHNFTKGSGFITGGMITTAKTGEESYLNFAPGSTWVGAGKGKCVDGYVQVHHNEPFIFPIGTADKYRPVAISGGINTAAAYFDKSPATLNNSEANAKVDRLSHKEYWVVKGKQAVSISFLWTASSDLSSITGGKLSTLKMIGLRNGQWEVIPSAVDEQIDKRFSTKSLGIRNTSDLTSGTITTAATIVPNEYEYFTLGSVADDVDARSSSASDNFFVSSYPNPVKNELYVDLKEISGAKGTIEIYNLYGLLLEERTYDNTSNDVEYINTSSYVNGIYKVVVRVDNRQVSHKFVVNRTQ